MRFASLVVLVVLVALLSGCARRAPPADGSHTWIRAPFRVHAGDDAAWASPEFDDSSWTSIDTRFLPGSKIPDWDGVAWFRIWIEIGPEQALRPVPIDGRFVGAAEVFLDGRLAFSRGDPGALVSGRSTSTPADFALDRPDWVNVSPGRHLLAVRFASRHVEALHRIGFPGGFEIAVGSEVIHQGRSFEQQLDATFVGAAGAFGLLHLLLFLFHRDRRENIYYAATSFGVASVTVFDQQLRWVTSASEAIAYVAIVGTMIVLASVLLLRFYHEVFSPRVPRSYWIIFSIALVIAGLSWTVPRPVAYAFSGLVALAQFRVLIAAVVRKASGAWIIGIGGALWLLGATVQMLGDVGLIPRLAGAYVYGFLGLLGSISIYLARDIARDKEDLGEAMKRYRTVFETTGTATITFGSDDVITLANEEWTKLTGHSKEEIEGRLTWRAFFSERSLEKMSEASARTHEAELRDRRGKLHEGVITISVVPGTGERVGSFLDLTDLKRAQRQMVRADKMAALGQIIAGVAHEINNPNNFIHFNLPILRKYVDAMRPVLEVEVEKQPDLELLDMRYDAFIEDLFKLIDNMEHGSERITAIVSELKHYIRSGEDLEMTTGSFAKVVEKVMALVGKQVGKMVKRVDVDIAEKLPSVRMNAGKIEQVLINLLINAGQAANKDASWVKLTVRAVDDGSAVEILVEDNGAGIPHESLEQIFEPFFTTKGRETGTGLGLSISQQIVEEHGGRLEVMSEVDVRTCFTLRLPAA